MNRVDVATYSHIMVGTTMLELIVQGEAELTDPFNLVINEKLRTL